MSTDPLPYPPDTGRTHYEGCWRERGHHNCAVARVDELREELAAARAEMTQLVAFFNEEGAVLGREGDDRHRQPIEHAIHAMRELLALQAENAALRATVARWESARCNHDGDNDFYFEVPDAK